MTATTASAPPPATATPAVATTQAHPVVSRERWLAERQALLEREKALMRQGDALTRERRGLPWVRVTSAYVFDSLQGPRSLGDLFGPHRQLIVQHFMLGPGWEQGCPSCSFMADHLDAARVHLAARDVAFVAVSRAPLDEIERFRRRMGWGFDWVSSHGNRFNHDFGVSFSPAELASGAVDYNYQHQPFPAQEAPGLSVFLRGEAGEVLHTYSTYGRGVELTMGTYPLLDITPLGRQEEGLAHTMGWVRHHDRYPQATADTRAPATAPCCHADT